MNVVFAGTPAFAVPTLRAIVAHGHAVSAVLSQPSRPAGRGRHPRPSAVQQAALELGLPVHQPERIDAGTISLLAALHPELLVVVAYGLILPAALLLVPTRGAINVHASLLPRWRGAAPVARAIEAGDALTGISIMQIVPKLDSGPVFAQASMPIEESDTAGTLEARLAEAGARLLVQTLDALAAGPLEPRPQDEAAACYAAKIRKEEALLDWSRPALELHRRVRAFNPRPVAHTGFRGQRLRVWESARVQIAPGTAPAAPGTVLATRRDGIAVQTGAGALALTRVQLEGGKIVTAAEFLNGHRLLAGEQLT